MINSMTFKGYVTRLIDGDTVVLNLDLGFKVWKIATVRLKDFNAAEIRGGSDETKALGHAQTAKLATMTPPGSKISVTISDRDKYGRWVGTLYDRNGRDVCATMRRIYDEAPRPTRTLPTQAVPLCAPTAPFDNIGETV